MLNDLNIQLEKPRDAIIPDAWVGDNVLGAKNWPMLSIAGISPHFHTPLDLAEAVTTPDLLANAIDRIYQLLIEA